MSVERVSGEYTKKQDYLLSSEKITEDDVTVFGEKGEEELYTEISAGERNVTAEHVNLSSVNSNRAETGNQDELTEDITEYLDNIVTAYEEQFQEVKENNGIIAKGWDWFKNKTGIGAGSDKVQAQITELKSQIEELKKDPTKLKEVYKAVIGKELNEEELNNLMNNQVDLSKSEVLESVLKYTQGQKQCTNIISGITSSLTVVGLIAAGVVTAPFTGGMSIAASVGAIGALTAAGTAAYMVPQVIDGVTEKDGYSFKETMQDIANGVINSAFTAIGMGGGKAAGKAIGKAAAAQAEKTLGKTAAVQIGEKAAGLAASETTSLIIGDGIGIGNYLTEAAFNDDVDFSWTDLGKTAMVSTTSSLTAGAAAFGASSIVRPVLTSGTTASSQIVGRLLSAGITGGSASMSAAAMGGGTNYLLTCAIEGKEVSFEEWLNASKENMDSAMLTGFIGGMAFEAVHIAAGTPKPEGAVKSVKGTNEYGLKYTNYLDKDGNVIATDISASDAAKVYGSAIENEQGLIQYDSTASSSEGKVYDTIRTVRVSYTNIPNEQFIGVQDGSEVFTQTQGENYRADLTIHDWADNSIYLGSGVINGSNIPHTQQDIVEAEYEVVYDEVQTPELNGNGINTPQLIQGAPVTQENGLVPLQSDNPNSHNIDLVVDTTLAQAYAQAQVSGVQTQAQDAGIYANAVTSGILFNISGGNNVPPMQVNTPQQGTDTNIPVQTQVTEQTASEGASSVLPQETTEPQLPTPEEIEQRIAFLEENYPKMSHSERKLLAELDSLKYSRAVELKKRGISYYNLGEFYELDYKQYQRAIELLDKGVESYDVSDIVSLDDNQYQRAIELLDKGIDAYEVPNIANNDKYYQRAIELLGKGASVFSVTDFISLDDDQYQRAIELLDKGIDAASSIKIAKLENKAYQRAVELLDKGILAFNVVDIANNDKQYHRAIELLDKGFDAYDVSTIVRMNDNEYQRAVELLDKGVDAYNVTKIARLSDEQYQWATELLGRGMGAYNVIKIVNMSKDEYQKAIELLDKGVDASGIPEIVSLYGQQYERAMELLNKGVDASGIPEIVSLYGQQYERAMELLDKGVGSYYVPDIASLDDNQYQRAMELLDKGVGAYDVSDMVSLDDSQYQKAMKLIDIGLKDYSSIKIILSLPEQKQQTFIEFLMKYKDKGYSYNAIELQNDAGVELVGKKESSSVDNESDVQPNEEIKIAKTVTVREDGIITESTSETQGDKSINWYYGKDRTVILYKINGSSDIAYQIEIVNNENGEPSYILYTKESDKLKGAYETTRYDLSDYPEDMDVIEAIQNGTIKGGKIISSVSSENGLTQYEENYEYNNSNIHRSYIQKVDETGEIKFIEYKYDITDEKGQRLLSVERSWRKNPDGTTTTVINGKTYVVSFDDEKMEITITQEKESPIKIDIKSKISPYKKDNTYQKNTFGSKEAMHRAFFEFLKTMPADQLINLSRCTKINIVEEISSSIDPINKELSTGLDVAIISHEMGHGVDLKNATMTNKIGIISGNQEVINIYNEEMRNFQLNYPEQAQEIIRYFSQTGGSGSTGLAELVAEINMIMTTYGDKTKSVRTRSEYIVRYFPKTVAKIAELLGYDYIS